jgi:hypothetical protein
MNIVRNISAKNSKLGAINEERINKQFFCDRIIQLFPSYYALVKLEQNINKRRITIILNYRQWTVDESIFIYLNDLINNI